MGARNLHEDLRRDEREHRVELLARYLPVFVHVQMAEQALRGTTSDPVSNTFLMTIILISSQSLSCSESNDLRVRYVRIRVAFHAHLDEVVRVAFASENDAQLLKTDGAARVHVALGEQVRQAPTLALLLRRAHLFRRLRPFHPQPVSRRLYSICTQGRTDC